MRLWWWLEGGEEWDASGPQSVRRGVHEKRHEQGDEGNERRERDGRSRITENAAFNEDRRNRFPRTGIG